MARPKGTKQLLAAVALILCALALTAAGLAVRRQQFDRTLALRFADDVSHGFGWGRIARQVGLFHVYDLQAAGRIDNPPNGLDYTPLRLTVMSGFRFVRQAARLGHPVVIVNRGPTRGDDLATLKLDLGCSDFLQSVESGLVHR